MKKFFLKVKTITPFVVVLSLVTAGVFYFNDFKNIYNTILFYTLVVFSIPLWIEIIISLYKNKFGVDLIAGLALLVSVIYGEYFAGTIVLLMLSGGEALESYAMYRARRALAGLLSLVPTKAHIKTDKGIVDIESKDVVKNTKIIVKAGEVIPVDGVVISGESYVDESIMTGEPMPVKKTIDSAVFAGTTNTDQVIEILTTKPLSESRLEGIIEIVRKAEEEKAPFVRMADKYAVYFTLFTLIVSALAWIISGDSIRLLAVLVVATPCPLILATPIAFMSGMSALSKRGVVVKNGGALEAFSQVKSFVFDKTGTITFGVAKIHSIESTGLYKDEDIIKFSASLNQLSVHVLAHSLVSYANKVLKENLIFPENFKESFGDGVEGEIDGKKYFFGKATFLQDRGVEIKDKIKDKYTNEKNIKGVAPVYLGEGNSLIGVITFQDEIKNESKALFKKLHDMGEDTALLTGDKEKIALFVSRELGIDKYKADCLPEDKLKYIKDIQDSGKKVAMVGDGVNDAPALAEAHVGIALGSHGRTAASDTADMVIISSSILKVYDAYVISKHAVNVARQGIFIGIGLSSVFMIVASFGYLTPFAGALVQEGIDVAVILYALRAGIIPKTKLLA